MVSQGAQLDSQYRFELSLYVRVVFVGGCLAYLGLLMGFGRIGKMSAKGSTGACVGWIWRLIRGFCGVSSVRSI